MEVGASMSSQAESDNSNRFRIPLEVIPDAPNDADPALVDAVGRDTADALRNDGYTIEPVYTGTRGGGFLVTVLATAWAQKDLILADGSALMTIFTPVVSLAKRLHEAHQLRAGHDADQQSPIKISVDIDRASLSIETPNREER